MSIPQQALAGRGLRLGGAIIDAIAVAIINVPFMFVFGFYDDVFDGQLMDFDRQLIAFALGVVIFLAVHGYLLFHRGQTVGKALLGMKIVDAYGRKPEFGKLILMRYLILGAVAQVPGVGSLIVLLGFLLIFGDSRRCLHDYLASTRVVKADYVFTQVPADTAPSNE